MDPEGKNESKPAKNPKVKTPKVRKKALYKDVAKQMDLYFGDSNLLQDRFLKKEIDASQDGFVPVELFLKFNKIKSLGVATEDISKAVKHFSTLLELNDSKDKLRRTTPLASQEELDSRTVYVEGLPLTINHDWVIKTLSKYEKVNYVSLPKYSTTKKLKGFAFVEFASEAGAKACLSAIGTKEFKSLEPFPKAGNKDKQRMEKSVGKISNAEQQASKKRNKKRHSANSVARETTPVNDALATECSAMGKSVEASFDAVSSDEPVNKKAKVEHSEPATKPSRKRKRKSSQSKSKDEPAPKVPDIDSETDVQSTKSVVKTDTKKQKNEHMSPKKELGRKSRSGTSLKAISKAEWLQLRKQYLDVQKSHMTILKERMRERKAAEETVNAPNKDVDVLQLVPNVIVKIDADTELDRAKIKARITDNIDVSYIDVAVGATSGFIRCKTCDDASKLLKQTCGENYKLSLVEGEDEESYWQKLNEQRRDRRMQGAKTKTKRSCNKKGTKKVLEQQVKQAKKMPKNSHGSQVRQDSLELLLILDFRLELALINLYGRNSPFVLLLYPKLAFSKGMFMLGHFQKDCHKIPPGIERKPMLKSYTISTIFTAYPTYLQPRAVKRRTPTIRTESLSKCGRTSQTAASTIIPDPENTTPGDTTIHDDEQPAASDNQDTPTASTTSCRRGGRPKQPALTGMISSIRSSSCKRLVSVFSNSSFLPQSAITSINRRFLANQICSRSTHDVGPEKEQFSGNIPMDKLDFRYCRSGGAGGQHVNKVATKVELRFNVREATWIPDWIKPRLMEKEANRITKHGELIVTSDKTRKQILNQGDCLNRLRTMIFDASVLPKEPTPEELALAEKRKAKRAVSILKEKRHHSLKRASRGSQ
ncbi:la-related protein 7-like [Watersipora subatra]|uniref:la-related protein 7-like n=1 Tax=Watersipora subatra TaxID=2589382 RepID=UPI00355C1D56